MTRPFQRSRVRYQRWPAEKPVYETSRDFRHMKDKPITRASLAEIKMENPAISTIVGLVSELVSLPTKRHLARVERLETVLPGLTTAPKAEAS